MDLKMISAINLTLLILDGNTFRVEVNGMILSYDGRSMSMVALALMSRTIHELVSAVYVPGDTRWIINNMLRCSIPVVIMDWQDP